MANGNSPCINSTAPLAKPRNTSFGCKQVNLWLFLTTFRLPGNAISINGRPWAATWIERIMMSKERLREKLEEAKQRHGKPLLIAIPMQRIQPTTVEPIAQPSNVYSLHQPNNIISIHHPRGK